MQKKSCVIKTAGLLVLTASLFLTGCGGGANISKSDLMAEVEAQDWPEQAEKPDPLVMDGMNQFASGLLMQAAENSGNIMVSPASVFLALAMTLQGAAGETADAMHDVLTGKGVQLEQLNKTGRAMITVLSQAREGTEMNLANSIWFDNFFDAEPNFLQANADFYGAEARKLDFTDSRTLDEINGWVNEATREKIDTIIDQIDPSAVMYLINAVYFKSDWAEQFDKADTRDGQFFAPASEITSEFMYKTGKVKDISDSDIIGVALPYKDTDFVFFALMPADRQVTPRQWLANQSSDLFSELGLRISSGSDENSINLGMPKFEAEYEDSLKNDLSAMGMEIAFDPDRADFSGMQKSAERNLYIGEVKHKTYIKVDEKGTEAAAATSVEMRVTSAPIVDKDIIFDRPFIYGVMHMPSGTPLFAGIMENPSQN